MSIKIRYFASLRDYLGRSEDNLTCKGALPAREVWQRMNASKQLPVNTLVAINMDYVTLDHLVEDGDEVAFFPPVTGG